MIPTIDIANGTFKEVFERARKRIPIVFHKWTNFNTNDTGIMLIELFAWFKVMQEYHMNQIGKAHLHTYLKILGMEPKKISSSCGLSCCFNVSHSQLLERGSHFQAGDIPFESMEEVFILTAKLLEIAVYTKKNQLLIKKQVKELDQIAYHIHLFGNEPEAGNYFILLFDQIFQTDQSISIYIGLKEDYPINRNPIKKEFFIPLTKVEFEYEATNGWEKCKVSREDTYGLLTSGIVKLSIPANGIPQIKGINGYRIKICFMEGDYDIPPILENLKLNVVELEQCERCSKKIAVGNGFPNQTYSMGAYKIMAESIHLQVEQVTSSGKFDTWTLVADFAGSKPEDMHFVVEEAGGKIVFGNGVNGMPPEGEIILVSAKKTLGGLGNVKKGQIHYLPNKKESFFESLNFQNTTGGRDPETLEECFSRFQAECFCIQYAVTYEDYENIVKQTPGLLIEKVKVVEGSSGENSVDIVVQAFSDSKKRKLSKGYIQTIMQFMEGKRLIGTNLHVLSPEYIPIALYMELELLAYYLDAERGIKEKLRDFFLKHQEEFGKPVLYGEVYGFLETIESVKRIHSLTIVANGQKIKRNISGDVIPPPNGVTYLEMIQCSVSFSG